MLNRVVILVWPLGVFKVPGFTLKVPGLFHQSLRSCNVKNRLGNQGVTGAATHFHELSLTSKPTDLQTSRPNDLQTYRPSDLMTYRPTDLPDLDPLDLIGMRRCKPLRSCGAPFQLTYRPPDLPTYGCASPLRSPIFTPMKSKPARSSFN